MNVATGGSPWYPNASEIKDPRQLQTTLRRVLDLHYDLVNRVASMPLPSSGSGSQQGSGPISTKINGLLVEPVDISTLADGATLKFSKARGTFFFS